MFAANLLTLVTLVALLLYIYMAIQVGNARTKYNVPAPATTGNPDFERVYRVQMNTLESLVVFVPALQIFSLYIHTWGAIVLGIVWIAGRVIYMQGYMQAADKRSAGFGIQFIALAILLAGSIIGVIWNMLGIGSIL